MYQIELIKNIVLSNAWINPFVGLSQGKAGSAVALLSILSDEDSEWIWDTCIDLIFSEFCDQDLGDDYETGIIGIAVGLLFLKKNGLLEIDFEDIIWESLYNVAVKINSQPNCSLRESSILSSQDNLILDFVLFMSIYRKEVENCDFIQLFDKIKFLFIEGKITPINEARSLFFAILPKLFVISEFNENYAFTNQIDQFILTVFNKYNEEMVFYTDSLFMYHCLTYCLMKKSNELTRIVDLNLRSYIGNRRLYDNSVRRSIKDFCLKKEIGLIKDFKKVSTELKSLSINDIIKQASVNKLNELNSLKFGIPRLLLSANPKLKYKHILLL